MNRSLPGRNSWWDGDKSGKKREHGQRRGKERVSTRCREGPQESTAMSCASADNCRLGSAAIAIVYELQKDPTLSLLWITTLSWWSWLGSFNLEIVFAIQMTPLSITCQEDQSKDVYLGTRAFPGRVNGDLDGGLHDTQLPAPSCPELAAPADLPLEWESVADCQLWSLLLS